MLLSAEHLSINFGSRQLLEDVNFYLNEGDKVCLLYTSPSPRDVEESRMPSSA